MYARQVVHPRPVLTLCMYAENTQGPKRVARTHPQKQKGVLARKAQMVAHMYMQNTQKRY